MERVKRAFDYAKRGTKGELSKQEYKLAMIALFGHCPDKREMKQIFQNSPERVVTFAEFLYWVYKKGFDNEDFVDAKTLFVLLDKDLKGHLDITDFYSAANDIDLKIPRSVWQSVFKEMDEHKKGFLDLNDLMILMNV